MSDNVVSIVIKVEDNDPLVRVNVPTGLLGVVTFGRFSTDYFSLW